MSKKKTGFKPVFEIALEAEKRITKLEEAIAEACGIIEVGDQRLLASDGPAGNQPPELSLREWRRLYRVLNATRTYRVRGSRS